MGDHVSAERLADAALSPEEEAHLAACLPCRAKHRLSLSSLTKPSPEVQDAAPSLQGGRYRMLHVLGSGGMATVYRAFDNVLSVERAVKVLHPDVSADAGARVRFMTEARTMARLQHPHIVQVFDVQEDGDRVFIVMELLAETLMAKVTREGPFAPAEAARVMADVLDVLQLAHDNGVIHRDVKPHNVLLDPRGVAKLGDFGIARVNDRSREFTRPGSVLGTLAYMAPEQGGDLDGRADVYAAGATLYVLLTARQPPVGNGLDVWTEATRGLDPRFAAVIQRATREKRQERWATPREMAVALRALGAPAARRDGARAWLAASAALCLLGFAALLLATRSRQDGAAVPTVAVLPPTQGTGAPALGSGGGGPWSSDALNPLALDVAVLPAGARPSEADWIAGGRVIAEGFGTDHVWFRTRLHNPDTSSRQVWIELTNADIDRATLTADGFALGEAGLLVARSGWPSATPMPTFPLQLGPGATTEVVGEITSENERNFEVHAISDADLMPRLSARAIFHGAFYGALGVVGVIALALAARLRGSVFAAYGVYALALAVWMAVLDGHLLQMLPVLTLAAPRWMYGVPAGVSFIGMVAFALLFVGGRDRRVATLLRGWLGFFVLFCGVNLLAPLPWHRLNEAGNIVIVATYAVMASTTAVAARRGVPGAHWIAYGWLAVAAFGSVGLVCQVAGVRLPVPILELLRIAVACEVLGSALALGVRFQDILAQRDAAAASALAASRLGRYFPKTLVERILASEDEAVVRSERVLITVLFCDIRGFTDLSDRTSPERVTALLNEFLGSAVPIIERNGGTVDKMMGNGLMVLFGTPTPRPPTEQAQSAVAAALAMHAALQVLGDRWRADGLDHDVRMRVGIHQDYATVGNFGTAEFMTRTAIGGGVNLAARLENACTPGRILASFSVVTQARGLPWGDLEERTFKGMAHVQRVAELDPVQVTGDRRVAARSS